MQATHLSPFIPGALLLSEEARHWRNITYTTVAVTMGYMASMYFLMRCLPPSPLDLKITVMMICGMPTMYLLNEIKKNAQVTLDVNRQVAPEIRIERA